MRGQYVAALREEIVALNAAAESTEGRARELRQLRATKEALLAMVVMHRESASLATRQARQAHESILRSNTNHEMRAQIAHARVAAEKSRKAELETVAAPFTRTHQPRERTFGSFLKVVPTNLPQTCSLDRTHPGSHTPHTRTIDREPQPRSGACQSQEK